MIWYEHPLSLIYYLYFFFQYIFIKDFGTKQPATAGSKGTKVQTLKGTKELASQGATRKKNTYTEGM